VPAGALTVLRNPGRPLDPSTIATLGPAMRALAPIAGRSRPDVHSQQLRVGAPGDVEERRADRFADEAIRESDSRTAGGLTAPERRAVEAVRVHTDADAENSAELLGAEAYAVGGHIVFGPGRYDPASRVGRRLIAHELAHVLAEPQAAPVLRRQPKPAPPPPPLRYETGSQTFNPPGPGVKLADVKSQVAAKQTSGDLGKNISVLGVTAGTDAELFVWNALAQRADKSNWGTELDAVTAIGPAPAIAPPPAGGPAPARGVAPVGRMTIQIDASGNATAILVASGGLPAIPQFKDVKSASASLTSTFGISNVVDGSSKWTPGELSKVSAALSRLSAADRAALRGVELVRQATITGPDGKPRDGQFTANQAVDSAGVVTDTRQLEIADSAFADDATSFIGGAATAGPMSFETILHESGHAVEQHERLEAKHAEFAAQGAVNQAVGATNTALATVNAASTASATTFNGYPAAQQHASLAYFNALQRALGAINKFANETGTSAHPPSEKAAQAAITARDKAKAALPAGNPAITDWAALSAAQDTWFSAAQTGAAARAQLDAAKHKTAAVSATVAGGPASKRLKAFVDFVTSKKIQPLTTYAKDNWPGHPEEFYAEAYSLWLNDPEYLASQVPALKTWFDQGKYQI
jgi:hypothetical protein